jgi:hypothetical protein
MHKYKSAKIILFEALNEGRIKEIIGKIYKKKWKVVIQA